MTSSIAHLLHRFSTRVALSSVLAAVALAGCVAAEDELAVPEDELPTVSRTIVRTNADGTQTVVQDMITPAEQRAEIAARELRLAKGGVARDVVTHVDDGQVDCSHPQSIWLFDGPNLTGNEICFFQPSDYVLLENWNRWLCSGFTCFSVTWKAAVRSYWAGSQRGGLWHKIPDVAHSEMFWPWQRVDQVGTNGQLADTVTLFQE